MFNAMMYLMLLLPLGFPVAPWLFGARSGEWGIWLSTGAVLATLVSLPLLFSVACVAAICGQGAIAIFMLGPIWIASAVLTVGSAVIASYRLRHHGRRN